MVILNNIVVTRFRNHYKNSFLTQYEKSFNSDGQMPLTSNNWTHQRLWHNYADENSGLDLGQTQRCGGVKLVLIIKP